MKEITTNRRIARNTVSLYLRMAFVMLISLYAQRLLLQKLGVDDAGIYSVVTSVVTLFSFLNTAFTGATSRFLTYELGVSAPQRIRKTFSAALIIHIAVAIVVLILAETLGLWLLMQKLQIPPDRMPAAMCAYQCVVFMAMLDLVQSPFSAAVLANERMGVYAFIEVLSAALQLVVLYLLAIGSFDRLMAYALLLLAVKVIILLVYRGYCVHRFPECRFRFVKQKKYFTPLLSFSGWDLYGNACAKAREGGVPLLINMFFGVAYNFSATVASQASAALYNLSNTVLQASRPPIIKRYAAGEIDNMTHLMGNAAMMALLIFGVMFTPLFLEMPTVFKLWLGQVPDFAVQFARLLLLVNIFGLLNNVLTIGIHATGKIKVLSLLGGSVMLLSLPCIYFLFKGGNPPYYAYGVLAAIGAAIVIINFVLLTRLIPEFSGKRLLRVVAKTAAVLAIGAAVAIAVRCAMPQGFMRLAAIAVANFVVVAGLAWAFLLTAENRRILLSKLHLR